MAKAKRAKAVRLTWDDCAAIGGRCIAYVVAAGAACWLLYLAARANVDWSPDADPIRQGLQLTSITGAACLFALASLRSEGARRWAWAAFACLCVGANCWFAYTNASHRNASARDDRRGEMAAADRYESERKELVEKRDRAAVDSGRKSPDAIEALIDAEKKHLAWDRSEHCTKATLPESRVFCAGLGKLRAQLDAAKAYARASLEISALDGERKGRGAPTSISPEIDGIAAAFAWAGFPMTEGGKVVVATALNDGLVPLLVELFAAFGPLGAFRLATGIATGALSPPKHEPQDPLAPVAPLEAGTEESTVVRFVREALEPARGARIEPGVLYAHFRQWCTVSGIELETQQAFGRKAGTLLRRAKTKRQEYLHFALRPVTAQLKLVSNG